MCKREIYMLSVTNRGTNVIADTSDPNTFAVNVPANLRKNKECMITIQSGTIAYPLAEARDLLELGISTDLPILGYDTEVTSGFMSRNFNKLFSVNLPNISDSYPQYPEIGPLSSVGSNGAANNMGGATLVRIFNQFTSETLITIGVNTFKIATLESIIVRKTGTETIINMAAKSLDIIYSGEEIFNAKDSSMKERVGFIESLTTDQFEKVINVISEAPTLTYNLEYKCKKCGSDNKTELNGLSDFFQ